MSKIQIRVQQFVKDVCRADTSLGNCCTLKTKFLMTYYISKQTLTFQGNIPTNMFGSEIKVLLFG